MTQLEILKKSLSEAKLQRKLCKPFAGCLGNQYIYWNEQVELLQEKINHLKLPPRNDG